MTLNETIKLLDEVDMYLMDAIANNERDHTIELNLLKRISAMFDDCDIDLRKLDGFHVPVVVITLIKD